MDDRELDRRLYELYQFCEDNQFLLTIICKKLGIDIDKEIEIQQKNIENIEEIDDEEEFENEIEEADSKGLLDEYQLQKKEKAEQQQKYDIQIQKPYKKQ